MLDAEMGGIELQDLGSRLTAVNVTPPREGSRAASLTDLTSKATPDILAESIRSKVGASSGEATFLAAADMHTVPHSSTASVGSVPVIDNTHHSPPKNRSFSFDDQRPRHHKRKKRRRRKTPEAAGAGAVAAITTGEVVIDFDKSDPLEQQGAAAMVVKPHESDLDKSGSCSPLLKSKQKQHKCHDSTDCDCQFCGNSDMDMETYQAELEDATNALLYARKCKFKEKY